jgi:hypothetical protein
MALDKARFFLRLAEDFKPVAMEDYPKRREFTYSIDAALVFVRSALWLTQAEYKGRAGFRPWYKNVEVCLKQDLLWRFLVENRDMVVHGREHGGVHAKHARAGGTDSSDFYFIAPPTDESETNSERVRFLMTVAQTPAIELVTSFIGLVEPLLHDAVILFDAVARP